MKPYRHKALGILNPYGDLWTPEFFSTEAQAREHLESFWAKTPEKNDGFKVVPVRVTVSVIKAKAVRSAQS